MKQTEIGIIPDDWEVKELGSTNHIETGTTPPTEDLSNYGIEYFFVSPFDLGNSKYIEKTEKRLSSKGYSIARHFPKNSILFTCIGSTIGKIGISKQELTSNQQINAIFPNKNIDNEYQFYALQTRIDDIRGRAGQQAVPLINKTEFGHTLYPLPPTLAEQQKIAKVLSDVDNVISTLEKLITKKKNLKQGTMQQLLTGKKRLPEFGQTTATKQTELGEIPADWEIVNINKTCTIKARIGWQGLKSDEYLDTGDYLLITGTDFDNGFINWKNCNYVTEWRFKQDKNIQIKKGDVLITKDGTIGKVAFLNEIPMAGTLNSGVFVVRPKDYDSIDSVFLSLIFKSFWFDNFLEQITSGSTIVHLYQKDFVKFNYILPSKPEQTAIANVLSSMDKEIEALEAKLGKYRDLKTGMMQQLLTGKIRLA